MLRFRIRFKLPTGETINISAASVDVETSTGGSPYVLRSLSESAPINGADQLILSSQGFESEEDAWNAGRDAKAALLLAAATVGTGIDTGKDRASGSFGKVVVDMMLDEHGVALRSDVHGLTVFDDRVKTVFGSFGGRVSVGRSGDAFLKAFGEAINARLSLTEKQRLALELLGYSHFESSLRARFLTLITVVETLIESKLRPPTALAHVDALITATLAAALDENESASIVGGLQWLRFNSIGQATRALVSASAGDKLYGGKRPDSFFSACYEMRSRIVHTGDTPDELGQVYPELERLVRDLVTSSVAGTTAA